MRAAPLRFSAVLFGALLVDGCRWGFELGDGGTGSGAGLGGGGLGGETSTGGAVGGTGGANAMAGSSMGGVLGGASSGGAASGGAGTGGEFVVATGPFGPATEIPGLKLDGVVDDDPSFPDDRLELYFSSERGTQAEEIWMIRRDSIDDSWDPPVALGALINDGSPRNAMPGITSDGLTLYFVRASGGMPTRDIYVSRRATRDDPWGTPTLVGVSLGGRLEQSPTASVDELFLVWMQQDNGGDSFYASRGSTAEAWVVGSATDNLNTASAEGEPWISDDGLHMFFRRGTPDNDLFYTTRANTAEDFPVATPLDSINTTFSESDPWFTQDLSYVVFVSSRGGDGQRRIYEASR